MSVLNQNFRFFYFLKVVLEMLKSFLGFVFGGKLLSVFSAWKVAIWPQRSKISMKFWPSLRGSYLSPYSPGVPARPLPGAPDVPGLPGSPGAPGAPGPLVPLAPPVPLPWCPWRPLMPLVPPRGSRGTWVTPSGHQERQGLQVLQGSLAPLASLVAPLVPLPPLVPLALLNRGTRGASGIRGRQGHLDHTFGATGVLIGGLWRLWFPWCPCTHRDNHTFYMCRTCQFDCKNMRFTLALTLMAQPLLWGPFWPFVGPKKTFFVVLRVVLELLRTCLDVVFGIKKPNMFFFSARKVVKGPLKLKLRV